VDAIDGTRTFAAFTSRAPIVRWAGHSQGVDPLVDEIGAFFARLMVPVDYQEGAEARIAEADPEALYAVFLGHSLARIRRSTRLRDADPEVATWVRHEANRLPYLYYTEGTQPWPLQREASPVVGQSPSWLPDGRILYSGCLGDDCGILVTRADGSGPRQVAAGSGETNPEASPDGRQVVFMSQRDGNWEIYAVNVDGTGLRRLTQDRANDGLPTWSPDGRYIAFVSDRDGPWAIWIMRPDGADPRRLFELGGPLDGRVQDAAPHENQGWVEERISWSPLP
jgi:hypothetical protein